tara:strand:+ start:19 stop:747 length:729 start_codon:yes stop_codon:yes gene_type:complete
MKDKIISINLAKKQINLILNKDVFSPNLTSRLLINSVYRYSKNKKKFFSRALDLGCGCGAVGIALLKMKIINGPMYFSDLSKKATENTKINLKKNKVKGIVKSGSLFDPWDKHIFDLIINDVSAISSELIKISPWFKNIPCRTSKDGTELTIKFIDQLAKYTNKNSIIFFPVLSLSNKKKILNYGKKKFQKIKLIDTIDWPLPIEMSQFKNKLKSLKNKKFINFKEKYGKIICSTSVYMAKF